MYGPYMGWHHVDCFVEERETLEFFEEGAKMPGLKSLSKEDQQLVKTKLKKIERWVSYFMTGNGVSHLRWYAGNMQNERETVSLLDGIYQELIVLHGVCKP